MNWVKENKFLTAFIVLMLIGIGALGFEVYSAGSANDEASENYNKAATEYNRLRHLVPFPNRANLDEYKKQEDEAGKVISAFESSLAKKEFPLDPISPAGFQDKLKQSVAAVRAKAQESGVGLPDKGFYMGFEPYETRPPEDAAAAPLWRELKAIEWVVNQYLSHPGQQMQKLVALSRTPLPEEEKGGKGSRGSAPEPSAAGGGPGGRPGSGPGGRGPGGAGPSAAGSGSGSSGRRGLVQYHPFEITVICKQQAIMDVLDTITGPKAPQFYVLRAIRIKNSNEKGPLKNPPDAGKPEEKDRVQYIVGEEWLEVTTRWEVVDFATPAEKEAASAGASTPKPGASPNATPAPKSTPAPATPAAPALNTNAVVTPPTSLAPAPAPAPPATAPSAPAPAPVPAATPAPQSTPTPPKP